MQFQIEVLDTLSNLLKSRTTRLNEQFSPEPKQRNFFLMLLMNLALAQTIRSQTRLAENASLTQHYVTGLSKNLETETDMSMYKLHRLRWVPEFAVYFQKKCNNNVFTMATKFDKATGHFFLNKTPTTEATQLMELGTNNNTERESLERSIYGKQLATTSEKIIHPNR